MTTATSNPNPNQRRQYTHSQQPARIITRRDTGYMKRRSHWSLQKDQKLLDLLDRHDNDYGAVASEMGLLRKQVQQRAWQLRRINHPEELMQSHYIEPSEVCLPFDENGLSTENIYAYFTGYELDKEV